ncbi:MAG: CidA/LrgA family protein [Oscillospiraceae bacterium]|nr:CidA/LrgA family protein [Oscillospiraceae bacterium]
MKFIKQLAVIILVCFAGELVRYIIPLPVPGSIWGLVLMFILLVSGVIKLEKVETAADFLIDCMPIMFVPGGVGLMRSRSTLKSMLPAAVCSIVLVTPFVMLVTGKVTQLIIERGNR